MFIKNIELNNFRLYKGNNNIDVEPSENKNIIVVSGKNGFGKTTLLMSLVWCLYGKQMDKVDELYKKEIEDKGGYGKFIGTSLNRIAEERGETRFSVAVTFINIKIPEITCNEIKIIRSYNVKTGTSEKLEILIDGQPNELIQDLSRNNQNGGEVFIREFILPLEIAKFFFFDAEKIVSLAEVNSTEQRKSLGIAYSEVLGIHKYEELKNQLLSIQDDYKKKSAKPEDRRAFVETESNIKIKEMEISDIETEIDNLKVLKVEKKHDADEIQRKLIKEGNFMTVEQVNQLKNEEAELEKQIILIQDSLKELFDLIPFGLAGETMMDISEQLNSEKLQKQSQFKKDDYNNKVNVFIQDLDYDISIKANNANPKIVLDRKIKQFYKEGVEKLIEKHFYADVKNISKDFQSLHDFSDSQMNDFSGVITNLIQSFKDNYTKINNQYTQDKRKLDSIKRKLREAEKNAEEKYIADLRDKKEELNKQIENIDFDIFTKGEQIGELKNELKTYRQKKEELRKKIAVSDQNKAKNDLIESEIKQIKQFIVKFKEAKKKSLENKIKSKLNILMHKQKFISKVEVDINILGDNVEISLFTEINEKERKIDKGSLSMEERQMYASALLSALVEESNIEFPVFIDSPIQKFDDDHATNVIKYFYPSVSEQVVLFPLIHTELSVSKYNLLKEKVAKSYLIQNRNNESSTFLNVEPNQLIEKYNELYVASN